jgi:5-methylcytosine-specific restriction endonuclease McrA
MYQRTFTPEMIAELPNMTLVAFSQKYKMDKGTASRYCKNNGIPIYGISKGKEKPFTQEMIDDLGKLGNVDFRNKWNISFTTIAKYRVRYNIKAKNNVGGRIDHKFESGTEYKLCPRGGKHWESIENFNKCKTAWDGLRGVCKTHLRELKRASYFRCDENGKTKQRRKDPFYREKFRVKDQRSHSIRKHAHISWIDEDSKFVHILFGNRCVYCGKDVTDKFEIDHFMPIKLGGLTEPNNMVLACPKCNHEKNALEPMFWMTKKFGEDRAILIYRDIKQKLKKTRRVESEGNN